MPTNTRVFKEATRNYRGIFKAMIYYEMDSDSPILFTITLQVYSAELSQRSEPQRLTALTGNSFAALASRDPSLVKSRLPNPIPTFFRNAVGGSPPANTHT